MFKEPALHTLFTSTGKVNTAGTRTEQTYAGGDELQRAIDAKVKVRLRELRGRLSCCCATNGRTKRSVKQTDEHVPRNLRLL